MDPRGRPFPCSERRARPPWRHQPGPRLLAALALLWAAPLLLAAPAWAEEQLLAVVLNGYETGAVVLVEEEDKGRLLAPLHELGDLRINTEGLPREDRGGRPYAVLTGAPGVSASVDRAGQRLLLTLDDSIRARQKVGAEGGATPSRQIFSAFLDYDVVAESVRGRRSTGALVDAGISDEWGAFASSALYRTGTAPVRLDTTLVHDDPDGPTRYLIGDGIARPASWGRPARFGGVQIAREFGLQPNMMRYAGPVLQGQAELPSTVEVYVDNILRYRTKVEPGPFALEGVPFMTGSGEARVIVRDPLGRETTVAAPFQVSPRVLPEGASDFALQAGALRSDYARRSFSYREPFVAGFLRHGTGGGTTVEVAAEMTRGWRTVGVGGAAALPYVGAAEISGAVSSGKMSGGKAGRGWVVSGAYQFTSGPFSLGLNAERSSRNFQQLGRSPTNPVIQRLSATASLTLGERLGSLSATYASLRFADNEKSSVAALSYGVPLWGGAYLAATGLRDLRGKDTTLAMFLTVPLGPDMTVGAEVQRRRAGLVSAANVQQRPAEGRGWGTAARLEAGAGARQQASLTWDGQRASAALDAEHGHAGTAARISAAGSLVLADGELFAARKSQSGRALVRIPGREGLTVYSQNRPAGTLDADGAALIPDLLPYQENRISISMDQLPLTARLENDVTVAVPRYRGTALVTFDVRDGGGAFVTVRRPDGRPLPAGTRLASRDPEEALVAGEDGRVFVPGARTGTRIVAEVDGRPCTLVLGAVSAAETLPDLGAQSCSP